MSWVIALNPSKVVDVSSEKQEIISFVNNHDTKPSFDGKTIQYILGEELVLEDTNNVLQNYTTSTKGIIIEENKLIIKKDFSEKEILLTKPKYTDKEFYLYVSGNSQKMISTGLVDNLSSKLNVKLTGGTIEINKLDKDTSLDKGRGEATLKGAVYELYDSTGNVKGTIITGEKNKLENLPIGKYTLKEKTPSKGYLLDTETYNIEITKDNLNINLTLYEKVIERKVEIFKVFGEEITGELEGELGINFEIYNKDKELISTITTDEEGYANIILPYGTYTFKQTTTTKNYYKVKDFRITISENDERPIHKILSNSEIKAKIKIIKKDFETRENITGSNIKFKIYDLSNNKYLSFKVSYPENKVTEEFQIDKNGVFITPISLPSGTYHIYEVDDSMDGYLYNYTPVQITINENANLIEEDSEILIEVPFFNQKVTGTLNITKYGEEINYLDHSYYYKKIALEGVKLNLYAKEDIYQNSKLIYKQDDIVKELVTDTNGLIKVNNLPLGKYYIKEIETVGNHILDTNMYDVELKYKDQYTGVVEATIELENKLPKGKLIINKYETNSQIKIPNTLIEIHTEDGKTIYKDYTDQNGQIILENIPYDNYYLSEIEASTGYRILEDKITFQINSEEKIIDIYNERLKVPNTGISINIIDILILILTIIAFIIMIILKKEKNIIIVSILIILLGITHYIIKIYNYYNDRKQNEESVSAYINNEIEIIEEEKYKYSSILEIPSININRGITAIDNEYNNAKYNIELIKEDNETIVLAAHNGNNPNSYFKDLKNMSLGDSIKYYKDGTIYTYIYSESYDIKKNGYTDIYRKDGEKSIILITCKDNTEDAQTVYIGYLKETNIY